MSITHYEQEVMLHYNGWSEDELLYEMDNSLAYLQKYHSEHHSWKVQAINTVLRIRHELDAPHDDCTHWLGNIKEADDA